MTMNRLELVHQVAEGDIRSFTVVYDHGIHHGEMVFEKIQYQTWRKSTYMDEKIVTTNEEISQDDAASAMYEYVTKVNNSREGYSVLVEYSDEYKNKMSGGVTKDEVEAVVGQMFQQLQNHVDERMDKIESMLAVLLNGR